MARVDSFEVTADDNGRATFELFSGEGEHRERICEERIRDPATAQLWLALLGAPGELEYDEAFATLRLVQRRPAGPEPPAGSPRAGAEAEPAREPAAKSTRRKTPPPPSPEGEPAAAAPPSGPSGPAT